MQLKSTESIGIRTLAAAASIAALGVFAHYTHALFLRFPPVWPDEAMVADAAINLVRHGSMGTPALTGTFTGIEQNTYLNPPLYYLYVAAWFRFCGMSLAVMKVSSLAVGACVLVTTYLLSVQSGLSRWLALLPPSLLAVDTVFLRASIVGRVDVVALELILLALLAGIRLAASERPTVFGAITVGLLSGLAVSSHAIGVAAPIAIFLVSAVTLPKGSRARTLVAMAGGLIVPLLGWGLYILRDPASFAAQFGAQLARKATAQPLTPLGWLHGLVQGLSQYTLPLGFLAALLWGAGTLGLLQTARARKGLWSLAICQLLLLSVIATREIWYPVYLLPLAYIGAIHLVRGIEFRLAPQLVDGLAVMALLLCFVVGNVRHLSHLRATAGKEGEQYWAFCGAVSANIPAGSKVLLDAIPDPYFGLLSRRDLQLREFLPEKIPVDPGAYARFVRDADYVVVGSPWSPSAQVAEFALLHGKLTATIDRTFGEMKQLRIYRIPK